MSGIGALTASGISGSGVGLTSLRLVLACRDRCFDRVWHLWQWDWLLNCIWHRYVGIGALTASGISGSGIGYLTASGLGMSGIGALTASGISGSGIGYQTRICLELG
jgi:hypothetical protein